MFILPLYYMAKKSNLKEFIEKVKSVHIDKYDCNQFIYANNATKGKVFCLKCNKDFYITPNSLLSGRGCNCNKKNKKLTSDIEKWTKKANLKHNNKYDYSEAKYLGYNKKIKIICKEHGEFIQNARDHIAGAGCPKCAIMGYKKKDFVKKFEMATLYIIKCWNKEEVFYKIGITGLDIEKRFNTKLKMPYNYEIIKDFYYFSNEIWNYEKEFHKKFKIYKYKPKIKFSGRYECFNENIKKEIYDI